MVAVPFLSSKCYNFALLAVNYNSAYFTYKHNHFLEDVVYGCLIDLEFISVKFMET